MHGLPVRKVTRLALLIAAAGAAPASAQNAVASTSARVEWTPVLEAAEIFPSIVLMSAGVESFGAGPRMAFDGERIGDRLSLIGAQIRALANAQVRLEIDGERRVAPSVIEAELTAGQTVRLFPRLRYRWDLLRETFEPVDEQITFRVIVDGVPAGEATRTVRFRSVDEFPLRQTDVAGQLLEYPWSLAGAVNENDAIVDHVLQESRARSAVSGFAGYAHGDREVALQVVTLWAALERLGLRIDETEPHAGDVHVVRRSQAPWKDPSLRCVEAGILIASVLQRIGLDPVLLLTRDHALVGFYRDASHESVVMLDPRELSRIEGLRTASLASPASIGARMDRASVLSFEAAVKAGERAWDAIVGSNGDAGDYLIVDVALARRAGITPVRGRFHDLLR